MCHHIHCHQLIIYGCGTQPKRCKFVLFDLSPSKIKIASRLKARRRMCNLQNKMRKVSITPKVLNSIYNFAAAADAINKLCAPSLSLRNKRFLIQCLRRRTINENPGLKLHLLRRVFQLINSWFYCSLFIGDLMVHFGQHLKNLRAAHEVNGATINQFNFNRFTAHLWLIKNPFKPHLAYPKWTLFCQRRSQVASISSANGGRQ